jgi:hypothetical protein
VYIPINHTSLWKKPLLSQHSETILFSSQRSGNIDSFGPDFKLTYVMKRHDYTVVSTFDSYQLIAEPDALGKMFITGTTGLRYTSLKSKVGGK